MKSQINSLTSTRAIAAILVVVHHYGNDVFPFKYAKHFFHNGNVAVSYFFVLSGFVMYCAYNNSKTSYANFIKKRVGRIVPVYLFALLITVLTVLYFSIRIPAHPLPGNFKEQVLLHSLLLQSFVPEYPLTLNGPGWSLSVEMFFYLLFPLLLVFQKKNFRVFLYFAVVFFIITQAVHIYYFNKRNVIPDELVDVIFFNPVFHLNQFIIGMLGGYIFERVTVPIRAKRFLPFVLFVIIIVVVAIRPQSLSYQTGLIAPLFMLFIVSMAICDPAIMNIPFLIFLGNVSFGIYILQYPVHELAMHINGRLHLKLFYFFYSYLFVLVLVSMASYYCIEVPLRNKINALTFKKKVQAA